MSATMEREEKQYDKLDTAMIIMDFFAQCAEQGIESISTREILHFLGETSPKFPYENKVYDLTTFDKAAYRKMVEALYHSPEILPESVLNNLPNKIAFFKD